MPSHSRNRRPHSESARDKRHSTAFPDIFKCLAIDCWDRPATRLKSNTSRRSGGSSRTIAFSFTGSIGAGRPCRRRSAADAAGGGDPTRVRRPSQTRRRSRPAPRRGRGSSPRSSIGLERPAAGRTEMDTGLPPVAKAGPAETAGVESHAGHAPAPLAEAWTCAPATRRDERIFRVSSEGLTPRRRSATRLEDGTELRTLASRFDRSGCLIDVSTSEEDEPILQREDAPTRLRSPVPPGRRP